MRRAACWTMTLLVWTVPLQAQERGWTFSTAIEAVRFGATATDTLTDPAGAVDLRPSGRLGARIGAHRGLGAWAVGVVLGWAPGNVEAANDAVVIRDRTADLSRYRAAVEIERKLAHPGGGTVALSVAPALDLWSLDGETRTRAGLEAGLALRLPLGGVLVEHRVAVGLSAAPIERGDVGGEFVLRSLRTVGFGLGLRVPL